MNDGFMACYRIADNKLGMKWVSLINEPEEVRAEVRFTVDGPLITYDGNTSRKGIYNEDGSITWRTHFEQSFLHRSTAKATWFKRGS